MRFETFLKTVQASTLRDIKAGTTEFHIVVGTVIRVSDLDLIQGHSGGYIKQQFKLALEAAGRKVAEALEKLEAVDAGTIKLR